MIKKALKKPFEVQVLQWTGNSRPMFDFLTNTKDQTMVTSGEHFDIKMENGGCQQGNLYVNTLNGPVLVKMNDYVIKGFMGEFYPCNEKAFKETYDIIVEKEEEK